MGVIRTPTSDSTHGERQRSLACREGNILESKIDSLMRRLEKMEIEKKEAQDLKAAEARSTCEE
jgi:hypothetical protein